MRFPFRLFRCIFFSGVLVFSIPLSFAQEASEPDYLELTSPAYPDLAREKGWEGTVLLKALVDEDGVCKQVAVEKSSGHPVLDESAVEAVKNWKFYPARVGNSSYTALTHVPVRFVLTGKR